MIRRPAAPLSALLTAFLAFIGWPLSRQGRPRPKRCDGVTGPNRTRSTRTYCLRPDGRAQHPQRPVRGSCRLRRQGSRSPARRILDGLGRRAGLYCSACGRGQMVGRRAGHRRRRDRRNAPGGRPRTAAQLVDLAFTVKNAGPSPRGGCRSRRWRRRPDPQTIRIELEALSAVFIRRIAGFPLFAPLPLHVYRTAGDDCEGGDDGHQRPLWCINGRRRKAYGWSRTLTSGTPPTSPSTR